LKKRDRLIKALTSIPNYEPNVIDDPDIIKNDDVYLFDKMFEIIDKKVSHYMRDLTDEDQIILNLTSGTPEMIAAMFSVNRIKGLNVQAFQVMTPSKGSNKDIKHDNDVPIEDLINSNLDNKEIFESRIVQDKAERYGQELLKKRAIYYVNMYNYSAVLDLITSKSGNIIGKGKRKK
ncbi:CARF domain-containing protein, partial [Ligilactobacillus acidipiscis]